MKKRERERERKKKASIIHFRETGGKKSKRSKGRKEKVLIFAFPMLPSSRALSVFEAFLNRRRVREEKRIEGKKRREEQKKYYI